LDVISSNISAGNIPKGLLNNVNNSRFLRPPKALPSICLIELLWRKRTFSGVSAKVFPGMYVILLCIIISVCMFVSPAKVRRLILEMWLKFKSNTDKVLQAENALSGSDCSLLKDKSSKYNTDTF